MKVFSSGVNAVDWMIRKGANESRRSFLTLPLTSALVKLNSSDKLIGNHPGDCQSFLYFIFRVYYIKPLVPLFDKKIGYAFIPPSIVKVEPVIYFPSVLARKVTKPAISAPVP